jgi:hypothetical protein
MDRGERRCGGSRVLRCQLHLLGQICVEEDGERDMPYLPPLPLAVVALEEALVVWHAVLAGDEPDDERKVSLM